MNLDDPVNLTSSLAKLIQYFCKSHAGSECSIHITGLLCLVTGSGKSLSIFINENVKTLDDDSVKVNSATHLVTDSCDKDKLQTEVYNNISQIPVKSTEDDSHLFKTNEKDYRREAITISNNDIAIDLESPDKISDDDQVLNKVQIGENCGSTSGKKDLSSIFASPTKSLPKCQTYDQDYLDTSQQIKTELPDDSVWEVGNSLSNLSNARVPPSYSTQENIKLEDDAYKSPLPSENFVITENEEFSLSSRSDQKDISLPIESHLSSHQEISSDPFTIICDTSSDGFGSDGFESDNHEVEYIGCDSEENCEIERNPNPFSNNTICDNFLIPSGKLNSKEEKNKTEPKPKSERRYICAFCSKSFKQMISLKTHDCIHTAKLPNQYEYFGEFFKNNDTVTSHESTHEQTTNLFNQNKYKPKNDEVFRCKYCDKSFTISSALKTHERIHTGERPFICRFCNKSFTQSGTLHRHERTHEKDDFRPRNNPSKSRYKCKFCNKMFTQKGSLNRHQRIHINESTFW